MGYTTSTVHGIQVPDSSQANNIPNDLGLVVTALEGGSLVKRLTQAQINALTSPQKPAGLVVFNTTTSRLQVSNGTSFADVGAPVYAVGERTTPLTVSIGAWTDITYNVEDDPSSMLNAGTGYVTLPSAGVWAASAAVARSSAWSGCVVSLIYNAGTDKNIAGHELTQVAAVSGVFVATAGSTIRAQFWNQSGSATVTGRFAVAKIGA